MLWGGRGWGGAESEREGLIEERPNFFFVVLFLLATDAAVVTSQEVGPRSSFFPFAPSAPNISSLLPKPLHTQTSSKKDTKLKGEDGGL